MRLTVKVTRPATQLMPAGMTLQIHNAKDVQLEQCGEWEHKHMRERGPFTEVTCLAQRPARVLETAGEWDAVDERITFCIAPDIEVEVLPYVP